MLKLYLARKAGARVVEVEPSIRGWRHLVVYFEAYPLLAAAPRVEIRQVEHPAPHVDLALARTERPHAAERMRHLKCVLRKSEQQESGDAHWEVMGYW